MAERKLKKKSLTPVTSDDELPFTKIYVEDEKKEPVLSPDASLPESSDSADAPPGTWIKRRRGLRGLQPSIPRISARDLTELKHATYYRTMGGCPTGGDILSLNTLEAGVDYDMRIGRKVHNTRLEVRLLIAPPTTTSSYDALRVVVLYDKQPNGTTPVAADIFDLGVCNKPYLAPYNMSVNQSRFVFLKDWSSNLLYVSSTDASMVANPTYHDMIFKIPKKASSSIYGIVGDAVPITGQICLACFSYNNSATTNNNVNFAVCARLFYVDG